MKNSTPFTDAGEETGNLPVLTSGCCNSEDVKIPAKSVVVPVRGKFSTSVVLNFGFTPRCALNRFAFGVPKRNIGMPTSLFHEFYNIETGSSFHEHNNITILNDVVQFGERDDV
ncbi:MAG: hypothetical protein Q7J98_04725 [Kiritimatiellia bacterium]|nr:hypothetical protein [Kiritimatiellia bacterium]